MNLKIPAGILRATRLVRHGKLLEATAAIQRALRYDVVPREPDARTVDVVAATENRNRLVDKKTSKREPGRFVTSNYRNAAGSRVYKTYVPAAHSGQAVPLVVMLHGCKQGSDDFAAATRMNALAEEHGFIVVYPQQAVKANISKCWNWFQAEHQQRDRGEPSLIAGITREVTMIYGLDTRRVYIAGLSAGGAMAAIMGTTYHDLYAAVGIHSGLAYAAARDLPSAFAAMRGEGAKRTRDDAPTRRVPTIVFHGDRDTTVHPSNGDQLIAQASTAPSAAGAQVNDLAQDQLTVEQGNASGRAYTRTTYRDAAGKAVMEQWLVHGAAHAWSGGSAEGSFSDPTGPDASREMLRFFLEHQNT